MAVGDKRQTKSRSKGWTMAEERAWERRNERERMLRQQERANMLGAMTPKEREEFLAGEKAEQEKQLAEAEATRVEYARQLHEQRQAMVAESKLIGGYIQTELAQATRMRPSYGHQDGEWLDDPVACITGQGGFAEEQSVSAGIKVQVNIALDISNSMFYNNTADVSVDATRNLYLALDEVSKQLPFGTLKVNLWTWAGGEDGKQVKRVSTPNRSSWQQRHVDDPRGVTVYLPEARHEWTGEDTWLFPLLERLDKWEQAEGDHGAYRLDLIISDGVLDHPTDARKGDKIQDERDGRLQSVVLNFLPFSEWADYRVPNRCTQYPVDNTNLMPMMRQILGEWLVSF